MSSVGEAVKALRGGAPVILPTDTVYGLCALPWSHRPAARVYELKRRPTTQPIALLASDVEMLLECMPELRGRSATIARAVLPGPYTLVLPNPAHRFRWLAGTMEDRIGVRVGELPPAAEAVLAEVGAVLATSANLPHGPDPPRLTDVPAEIRAGCEAEIDAGELPGVPSTVVDLTGREPRVLREGAVPAAEALERLDGVPA